MLHLEIYKTAALALPNWLIGSVTLLTALSGVLIVHWKIAERPSQWIRIVRILATLQLGAFFIYVDLYQSVISLENPSAYVVLFSYKYSVFMLVCVALFANINALYKALKYPIMYKLCHSPLRSVRFVDSFCERWDSFEAFL